MLWNYSPAGEIVAGGVFTILTITIVIDSDFSPAVTF